MHSWKSCFVWGWLILLVPGIAVGGDWRELQVEVSYAGQAVSYNLYKNDTFVCNRPSDSQLVCLVELDATPMAFVLTAVDESGVESMPSAPFMLDPLPHANFITSVSSGGGPLSVHFDGGTSSDAVGEIIRYVWDFGDAEVGTGQYIDHTFATAGSYTVRLTVFNDAEVMNEKANLITVGAENPMPAITYKSDYPMATAGLAENPMQAITYKWDYPMATAGLAGFKLYMNGGLICATANPAARSLTCNVPKSVGAKSFYLTAIGSKGIETSPSNRLQLSLEGTGETAIGTGLAPMQSITYSWDYPVTTPALARFKLYMNGVFICATANPAARSLTCTVPKSAGGKSFYLTAIGAKAMESNPSNLIRFMP